MANIGRYELVRKVGSGGMAEVWKARIHGPAGFEKFVAIKRILPHLAGGDFLDMFAEEAKLVVRLVHPNIVQVLDFGEAPDEKESTTGYFIAMEYVAGQNLNDILKRLRERNRKLPLEIGLFVVVEVAKALSHAHAGVHESGKPIEVIHRDVSPHNILISYDGDVKVTDFGIAKVASALSAATGGMLKGKISYMSPEQATLEPLDARSDIFCIGILLYELVSGRRLFTGQTVEEIYARIKAFEKFDQNDPELSGTPSDVLKILQMTLQADPADRFQLALELEESMTSILGPRGIIESRKTLASLIRGLFLPEYQEESGIQEDGEAETTTDFALDAKTEISASFSKLPAGPGPMPDPDRTSVSSPSLPHREGKPLPDPFIGGPVPSSPAHEKTPHRNEASVPRDLPDEVPTRRVEPDADPRNTAPTTTTVEPPPPLPSNTTLHQSSTFPPAKRKGLGRWWALVGGVVLVWAAVGILVAGVFPRGKKTPAPTPRTTKIAIGPTAERTVAPTAAPTVKATATPQATKTVNVVSLSTPTPAPTRRTTPRPTAKRTPIVRKTPTPKPQFTGYGTVTILGKPWVQVNIDGRRIKGETPIRNLKLKSGPHTFVFIHPSRKFKKTRKITIQKGKNSRVMVDVFKGTVSVK